MQTIITWERGKEEAAEAAPAAVEEDAVEAQVRILVRVQDLVLDLVLVLVLAHVQDQDQDQAQAQAQVQAQVVQVVRQAEVAVAPGTQGKHVDLDPRDDSLTKILATDHQLPHHTVAVNTMVEVLRPHTEPGDARQVLTSRRYIC